MFLNIFVSAIIIFSVVIFFLLAVVLNGITKTPDNVELPEQCSSCHSNSCFIKFDKQPKSKETIQEFYKKCEETDGSKKEN